MGCCGEREEDRVRAICELRKGKAIWGLEGAQVSPVPTHLAWLEPPLSCPRYQQGWGSQRPFQPEERAGTPGFALREVGGPVPCNSGSGLCLPPPPAPWRDTPPQLDLGGRLPVPSLKLHTSTYMPTSPVTDGPSQTCSWALQAPQWAPVPLPPPTPSPTHLSRPCGPATPATLALAGPG